MICMIHIFRRHDFPAGNPRLASPSPAYSRNIQVIKEFKSLLLTPGTFSCLLQEYLGNQGVQDSPAYSRNIQVIKEFKILLFTPGIFR